MENDTHNLVQMKIQRKLIFHKVTEYLLHHIRNSKEIFITNGKRGMNILGGMHSEWHRKLTS